MDLKRGFVTSKSLEHLLMIAVFILILVVGFEWFSEADVQTSAIILEKTKSQLQSDVARIASDVDATATKEYQATGFTHYCVFDNMGDYSFDIDSNLPRLIEDSLESESEHNLFLYNSEQVEPIVVPSISIDTYPHYTCGTINDGILQLLLTGTGNAVTIQSQDTVSLGADTTLVSADGTLELSTPQPVQAEVEGTSVEDISVSIVSEESEIDVDPGSAVYEFSPAGATFDQPLQIRVQYDPELYEECPAHLQFHHYEDDGTTIEILDSIEINCEEHYAVFEIQSFSRGHLVAPTTRASRRAAFEEHLWSEPPIKVYRNTYPPAVGRTSFQYLPGTDYFTTNLHPYDRRNSRFSKDAHYFHWINRCNGIPGVNDCPTWNKGNFPIIRHGGQKRFHFSSVAKANTCSIIQIQSLFGRSISSLQQTARNNGLRFFWKHSQAVNYIRSNDQFWDVCYVENKNDQRVTLGSQFKGVILDYEVQDRRTSGQTRSFLERYTSIVKRANKEVYLYTNSVDREIGPRNGIDRSNGPRLLDIFDYVSLLYYSGDDKSVGASLREQMRTYNPQNAAERGKIIVTAEMKLNHNQIRQVSNFVRSNNLGGVNLWGNGARPPPTVRQEAAYYRNNNNNFMRKAFCLAFGNCAAYFSRNPPQYTTPSTPPTVSTSSNQPRHTPPQIAQAPPPTPSEPVQPVQIQESNNQFEQRLWSTPNVKVFRNTQPPLVDRTSFRYLPGTDYFSRQAESLSDRNKEFARGAYYFQIANHCNAKQGNNCRMQAENQPLVQVGNQKKGFHFSSVAKANSCTLVQMRSLMGRTAENLRKDGQAFGLKVYWNEERMIQDLRKRGQSEFWDVCYLENTNNARNVLPRSVKGIMLDYKLHDGRSPEESQRFLTRYAQGLKANRREAILYTYELDTQPADNSGIDTSNGRSLLNNFNMVTISYLGNSKGAVSPSLRNQLFVYKPRTAVDKRKVMVVVDIKRLSDDEIRSVSNFVRQQRLGGILIQRNGVNPPQYARQETVYERGGDKNYMRRLFCLSFGRCAQEFS